MKKGSKKKRAQRKVSGKAKGKAAAKKTAAKACKLMGQAGEKILRAMIIIAMAAKRG